MTFLIIALILLVIDGTLVSYLVSSRYFSPTTISGDVEIWNVLLFLFLLSSGLGLLVSIVLYLLEKFMSCGRKEFPKPGRSIKYGLMAGIFLMIILVLHIFHFLNFFVAILIALFVIIGIIIIR